MKHLLVDRLVLSILVAAALLLPSTSFAEENAAEIDEATQTLIAEHLTAAVALSDQIEISDDTYMEDVYFHMGDVAAIAAGYGTKAGLVDEPPMWIGKAQANAMLLVPDEMQSMVTSSMVYGYAIAGNKTEVQNWLNQTTDFDTRAWAAAYAAKFFLAHGDEEFSQALLKNAVSFMNRARQQWIMWEYPHGEVWAWFYVADAYLAHEKLDEVRKLIDQQISEPFTQSEIEAMYAQYLALNGKIDEAKASLDKSIAYLATAEQTYADMEDDAPSSSEIAENEIAIAYIMLGDTEEADKMVQNPEKYLDPSIIYGRAAYLRLKQGLNEEAVQLSQKAIDGLMEYLVESEYIDVWQGETIMQTVSLSIEAVGEEPEAIAKQIEALKEWSEQLPSPTYQAYVHLGIVHAIMMPSDVRP